MAKRPSLSKNKGGPCGNLRILHMASPPLQVMSRNRFLNILKFLRFGPLHEVEKGKPKTHIEPYLQLLRHKCQDILEPGRDIAIDESLRLWKGRLLFKQFIKTKRSRFRIKIFFVLLRFKL